MNPQSLEIDVDRYAEVAVWCSLPPARSTRTIIPRAPRLHVHLRLAENGPKVVDRDVQQLSLISRRLGHSPIPVTPESALAFLEERSATPLLRQMSERLSSDETSVTPERVLDLDQYPDCDFTLWASTPSILWTAKRPQERGIHAHVEGFGKRLIDDTFGLIKKDGRFLDRSELLEAMLGKVLGFSRAKMGAAMRLFDGVA